MMQYFGIASQQTRSSVKFSRIRSRIDPDVDFVWADGQAVGYTVHPKLYAGLPPKESHAYSKVLSNRRHVRRKAHRRSRPADRWLDETSYSEFERQVDNLVLTLHVQAPLSSNVPESEPPIVTKEVAQAWLKGKGKEIIEDVPPHKNLRPPESEVAFASRIQELVAQQKEKANDLLELNKDILGTTSRKPELALKILRFTEPPKLDMLQDTDYTIDLRQNPDGSRVVLFEPLEFSLNSDGGTIIHFPTKKYPGKKVLNRLVLSNAKFGTNEEALRAERLQVLQPFFLISRTTRHQAYVEMARRYLSGETDYGLSNWDKLSIAARRAWRIKSI